MKENNPQGKSAPPTYPAGLGLSPDMFTGMLPAGFSPQGAMSSNGLMSLATHALQQTSRETTGKEVDEEEAQARIGQAVKAGPFIGWVRNAINVVSALLKPENDSLFGKEFAPVKADFSQVNTYMQNIITSNNNAAAKMMYKQSMYLAMNIPQEEIPPMPTPSGELHLMVIEALTLEYLPDLVLPYVCIKITAGLSTNASLYHGWYKHLSPANKSMLRFSLLKIFSPMIDVCARSHRQYLMTVASLPAGAPTPLAPDFDKISDALGAVMGALM